MEYFSIILFSLLPRNLSKIVCFWWLWTRENHIIAFWWRDRWRVKKRCTHLKLIAEKINKNARCGTHVITLMLDSHAANKDSVSFCDNLSKTIRKNRQQQTVLIASHWFIGPFNWCSDKFTVENHTKKRNAWGHNLIALNVSHALSSATRRIAPFYLLYSAAISWKNKTEFISVSYSLLLSGRTKLLQLKLQ